MPPPAIVKTAHQGALPYARLGEVPNIAAAARAAIPTVNRATVFPTMLLLLVPYAVAPVRLQQGFTASEMGFELAVERQSTAGHLFWVLQPVLSFTFGVLQSWHVFR
jgi:hypothetical protein